MEISETDSIATSASIYNRHGNKDNDGNGSKKKKCKKSKAAFHMTDNICCGVNGNNSLRLAGPLCNVYTSRYPVTLCQRYHAYTPY